jgi:hypothetical protein
MINITDVISSDQIYTCSCDKVSPKHLRFWRVPKILIDVKLEDTPLTNKPYMIKLTPTDDKLINVVLSGGYNVQPNPIPNSLNIDKINKPYEKGIINKDRLLTLGYPTSGEPINIGVKTFPKPPNIPGITKKKIISNP